MSRQFVFALIISLFFTSSLEEQVSMPRPRGYFRIDLPEKKYQAYEGDCPYTFEYPVYARYESDTLRGSENCRANLNFSSFRAKLHLTYKPVNGNLKTIAEDSRNLAYRHSVRASGIQEYLIDLPEHQVYGIIYEIGGDAASSIQFHVSDSSRHFMRGSLYFFSEPNADSLAPVIQFLRTDIEHLLKTFRWKN